LASISRDISDQSKCLIAHSRSTIRMSLLTPSGH
jgi:hypothetical protein